jgi:hypothetical protein
VSLSSEQLPQCCFFYQTQNKFTFFDSFIQITSKSKKQRKTDFFFFESSISEDKIGDFIRKKKAIEAWKKRLIQFKPFGNCLMVCFLTPF